MFISEPMSKAICVFPSRLEARRSKHRLAHAILASSINILDELGNLGLEEDKMLKLSNESLQRLLALLESGSKICEIVEPPLYEWYFHAIKLYKRLNIRALIEHLKAVTSVIAFPLIRHGVCDKVHGQHLQLFVTSGNDLVLSGRVYNNVFETPRICTIGRLYTIGTTFYFEDSIEVVGPFDWKAVDDEARISIPCHPTQFWQSGESAKRVIEAYQNDLRKIHADPEPFRMLESTSPLMVEYASKFRNGLDLIARCWSDLYEEVIELTDFITMIDGLPFIGGSSISYFGTSFFRLDPQWSEFCYADHIVHEAAHQRLHVEFETEQAMLNGEQFAAVSPIRRDARPLHGVFHATFVFLRLSQFFERVMKLEPCLDAECRLHRHLLGLYKGSEQLSRYALWTRKGAEFFSSLLSETERLRELYPIPKAELYNNVGFDYEPVNALAAYND
jgi:hypothetical protein